ncbi:PREDICTED: nuclear transcription factor Y subunit A-2-like isoform X2 [Tarenaya hassleriana]|uniref:nuclear transcription factor Y subunit A-2-like isoform X2 n=1 Tax=Tarenaya hassleriana TaxID=28532 RepID=UPI00053C54D8|nr:PREDICTED: nuclear transcription factor Y subunit A-2-like isoform X2 [Tarenaya hassleriana]
MAMQTVYLKGREGIAGNTPVGQLLSAPQTTWWNVLGSQPLPLATDRGAVREPEQGMNKQNSATQFTLSTGDGKNSRDVLKSQGCFTTQSACFEFGFAQPPGRMMLPLNMETEDGPIYVNAKQYHGIIRRRQFRAKAILENKAAKCSKQPYKHYSRHLHAMRRPRGSGGRFLNTKAMMNKERDEAKQPQPSNSQNSEVVHPENGTMNSLRDGKGSGVSGSEATSMDCFLGSSVHSHSGMVMPSKWVAAVAAMDNGCCNLRF